MFDFLKRNNDENSFQVFISYSFEDKKIMNNLKKILRSEGIDCYVAEHDEDYGNSLSEKLSNAIDDSEALIVILTQKGSTSGSVNQEIGYAKSGGKKIIPLVEKGVEMPIMLQGTEYVKFSNGNIDTACKKIIKFLNKKFTETYYEKESDEESEDVSEEEITIIYEGEHKIYSFDIEKGERLVGKIQSDEPINVFVLNNYGLKLFRNSDEFSYQDGGERVKKTKINFKPNKIGTWNVVIENEENEKAEVDVFLNIK